MLELLLEVEVTPQPTAAAFEPALPPRRYEGRATWDGQIAQGTVVGGILRFTADDEGRRYLLALRAADPAEGSDDLASIPEFEPLGSGEGIKIRSLLVITDDLADGQELPLGVSYTLVRGELLSTLGIAEQGSQA